MGVRVCPSAYKFFLKIFPYGKIFIENFFRVKNSLKNFSDMPFRIQTARPGGFCLAYARLATIFMGAPRILIFKRFSIIYRYPLYHFLD